MRTPLLIRNLHHIPHQMRSKTQLLNPRSHARPILQRIHKQDSAFLEGLHLREDRLDARDANLGLDGEEELRALPELRLDPHASIHERDETLGDGETETGTAVFLQSALLVFVQI